MPDQNNAEQKNEVDLSGFFENSGQKLKQDGNDQKAEPPTQKSKLLKVLFKYSGGLIKNNNQASYFLFAVIFVIIAALFFWVLTSLSGPDIPQKALENPERGLPIID